MKYETAERLANAWESISYPAYPLRDSYAGIWREAMQEIPTIMLGIHPKQEKENFNNWYRHQLDPLSRVCNSIPFIGTELLSLVHPKYFSYYRLAQKNVYVPNANTYSFLRLGQISDLAKDGYDVSKVLNPELDFRDIAHSRRFIDREDFEPTHEYIKQARREMFLERIMKRFNVEPKSNETNDSPDKFSDSKTNNKEKDTPDKEMFISQERSENYISPENIERRQQAFEAFKQYAIKEGSNQSQDYNSVNKPSFSSDPQIEFTKRGQFNVKHSLTLLQSIDYQGEYGVVSLQANMNILGSNIDKLKEVLTQKYGSEVLSESGLDNAFHVITEEAKDISDFAEHYPEEVASHIPQIEAKLEKMDSLLRNSEHVISYLNENMKEKQMPEKNTLDSVMKAAEKQRDTYISAVPPQSRSVSAKEDVGFEL